MVGRFTLKIGDHLETADRKKDYNQKVFTEIAPRYDFITKALSFGCDAGWKRTLISLLPPYDSPSCLDLACGTGDIALLLADRYPGGSIVGLDITDSMLDIARRRNKHHHVHFINQDMGSLEFAPNSLDIVSGGYALRNAPDLGIAIREIARVLKPGGVAAFLDFSRPRAGFLQKLEYGILKVWTGFWGALLHRNHEVYSYIAESLARFPDRTQLRQILNENGLSVVASRLYFMGITELVVVRKAAPGGTK